MKLLCINASNPQPEYFHGKWIEEGKVYDGEISDVFQENGIMVHLDNIPGVMPPEFPGLSYGFSPDRFVEVWDVAEVINRTAYNFTEK